MLRIPDEERIFREASCSGKETFDSAVVAKNVARRRRRRGRIGGAYKCIYCKKWHLGFDQRHRIKQKPR